MRRRFSIGNQGVNYMAIEALEDGLSVTVNYPGSAIPKIEYSTDGVNWINIEIGVETATINCGEKLLFKGNYSGTIASYATFSISKKCNLKGDIRTLWYGDDARFYNLARYSYGLFKDCTTIQHVDNSFLPAVKLVDQCYSYMFAGCTGLITAPKLPATTLTRDCYSYMFWGCVSLTTAPELPATTLADFCYSRMFRDCISLTTAPELPATTLVTYCYDSMFNGCKNLNYIKAMFTTNPLSVYSTSDWVEGVASSGTFVKNKNATWDETGVNGIPSGWTVQNA